MNLKSILKEQIKNYILDNPLSVDRSKPNPYSFVAEYFNTDNETVREVHRNLRKRGLIEKNIFQPQKNNTSSTLNSEVVYTNSSAQITKYTDKEVKSLEDLIEACDIDTENWEVEKWGCKVYDGWIKENQNVKSKKCYSISATLKKRTSTDLVKQKEILLDILKEELDIKFENKSYNKNGDFLLELALFDVHFGKLSHEEESGYDYDLKIATEKFNTAVDDLLSKVDLSVVSKILFPVGNDLFNVDNMIKTTTGGTPQDTDTRFHKMFSCVKNVIISNILKLEKIAPVDVVIVPGNHDEATCYMLGEVLSAYFYNSTNVSINNLPTLRKYYQFGEVGILFTHGDKEKHSDLALIFASEQPKLWGNINHRFIQLGHLHHNKKINYMITNEVQGAQIQILPSISPNDKWHASKGFLSKRQAKAFLFDKQDGMIAELTHNVKY